MAALLYFRAPRFDISPESPTAPRLGSIFSNLRRLTAPLNQEEALSIPAHLVNQVAVAGFQDRAAKSAAGSAGLSTGLLAQRLTAGGGSGLMYAFASDRHDTYQCAELETTEFEPDGQFVRDSITASRRVQDFFQGGGGISSFMGGIGGRRVYMITGLKVATDFAVSRGGGGPVSVAAGAGAGPRLELKFGSSREVSHGPASGKIVFAYRAIKIRPTGHGEVRYKDLSGGQYGIGDDDSEDVELPVSWEVEPVGEEDILDEFPDEEEIVAIQH